MQPKVPVEKPNWQLIAAFIQRVGVQLASAVSYMVPDVLTVNYQHGFLGRKSKLFVKLKAVMFLKLWCPRRSEQDISVISIQRARRIITSIIWSKSYVHLHE